MATTEQFSLRWNNFHSNLTAGFHELLRASEMVDVTLSIEGRFLQAHKIVLSICSPMFREMFKINPCKHPIVILRDVSHENMKDILQFMYMGEVHVLKDNLPTFLRTAELLQVKGLTGDDSSETSSRKDDKSDSIADNDDDDSDLMQFNQLIDSDVELPTHYSTSRVPTPPPVTQNLPTAPNSKRQPKNFHSTSNCKRSKTENGSSPGNKIVIKSEPETTNSTKPNSGDEAGYMEDVMKTEKNVTELDETAEGLKQIFDNSLGVSGSADANTSDHDVLLYTVDQKSHVYCPYCYRKFVNRYNLKVHIRDKHEDSPIALDCRVCGKVMRNRSCLRVHMYHHRKQQVDASV